MTVAPLEAKLAEAIAACRSALSDYETGVTTDSELLDRLLSCGLVRQGRNVYLLDLEAGVWHRYDGVTVHGLDPVVHRADLSRWRRTLDLLRQPDGLSR